MKAKKFLTIAVFYATVMFTGCGTKDEFDTPGTKDALSMDEATKIAWEDAKVSESELENLHASFNDGTEYTVTFTTAQKAYEYCIAASDGMILEKNVNPLPSATDIPPSITGEEQISPSPTAPAQTAEITQEDALAIAKKDAGVSDDEIFNLEVKLDEEAGVRVYEIDFDTVTMEYEYDIAVSDGKIVDRKTEQQDNLPPKLTTTPKPTVSATTTPAATPKPTVTVAATSNPSTPKPTAPAQTAEITKEDALAIAKKDAGVSEKEIFNLEIKLDYEDGIRVYEIEFDTTETEYEYDIAVSDGKIINRKTEARDHISASASVSSTPKPDIEITREDALSLAAKDAGISENEIFNLKLKLDYDDGIAVYEIDFDAGIYEYEYKIAALDGAILEKKMEESDDLSLSDNKNLSADAKITQEDALALAKADAGILDDELLDLKIEQDSDNGILYYDIEFCCGGCEYEYEIGVLDGKIWKKDCDDCNHSWHHFDNSHHGHDHY